MAAARAFRRDSRAPGAVTPLAQHRAYAIARHYRSAQAEAHPARAMAESDPVLLLCALGAGRVSDPGGLTRLSLWSRCLTVAMAVQAGQSSEPDKDLRLALAEIQQAFASWEGGEGRYQDSVSRAAFRDYVQCLERILMGQPLMFSAWHGQL